MIAFRAGELRETHLSVLSFQGDRVYKIRKPYDLGFVDYRSLSDRRTSCAREVDLNRRMAPDVYLGVCDVDAGPGFDHEPAVVMRRLPSERALTALIDTGNADLPSAVRSIARCVAAFHSGGLAAVPSGPVGSVEHVRSMWVRECRELGSLAADVLPSATCGDLRTLGVTYLEGRRALIADRAARGYVRDGHGDLQAADIFLVDDGPRIIDCLDFDETLRMGDVLLDVAFLAMDLERLGAPALATSFLVAYEEFSGETHPNSLLDFFVAYRALVRAKVAAIRYGQGEGSKIAEIRQLVAISTAHLRAAAVRIVCVGGLPGSGKTTVALDLAQALGAEYLSTDEIRDEMRIEPVVHPSPVGWGAGSYSLSAIASVYDEMLRRAALAVSHGMSVVLDASWSSSRERAEVAALARDGRAELIQVNCVVDDAVAADRLRVRRGGSSDANNDIRQSMHLRFEPWPAAIVLDTGADRAAVVERAHLVVLGRPATSVD